MLGRIALVLCLTLAPLSPGTAAAAPLPDAFLAASFLTNPIPADGQSASTLRVDVIRLEGAVADGTVVTVERDPASTAVCSLAGLGSAKAVVANGHADVSVTSSDEPGQCRITASASGAMSGEAVLTTKTGGTATRLTVSGNDSPRLVGAPVTLAVDIDDVYVNLVGGDETTVVAATADLATCSGLPADAVSVAAVNGGLVTDGRAWFSVRSFGTYGACRVTFTVPGLLSAVTTVSFASGPADHLSCAFTPGRIDVSGVAPASVELRDAFDNPVTSLEPYAVSFARAAGGSTSLLSDPERSMTLGAAFFFVRGDGPGIDEYTVSIASSSLDSLPAPTARCSVEVRSLTP